MKKTLLFGFALGLILSGCNKDEDLNNAGTNGVSFTSYMIGSRATDTAWEPNDEIGVYMQNAGSEEYANVNVKYANSEADCNQFTSTSPITYPEGGTGTVKFMAVYPYNENITDGGSYTFTLADGDLSENDIMYASAPSIDSGVTNVSLTFQHKLSKIILQLRDDQNKAVTGATVRIDNQCVNGLLNVADGVVSVAADAIYTSELTFAEGENGQYEVIVIPDEGREGRSIVITTTEGKTYRCPVGNIAFGNSKKYTFPVSLQAPASSGGETIIDLDMVSLNIDDWNDGKTVGWIVSPNTDLTTTKTEKELATTQQLTANESLQIPASSMTLVATDVYCIEYSRTDASAAATLTVAPLTQRSTDTKVFSLPLGVIEGKIVFAVGTFTGGVTLSSDVDLTLDVSVYSENESEGGDTETPSEPSEIEIWTGTQALVGWGTGINIPYTEDMLLQTTVGCTLRFYYSERQDGAQIQFANSETIDVTDNLEYVDMPVTETMINNLTGKGWLNGKNITVTKIVLIQPA